MIRKKINDKINDLFQREQWEEARVILLLEHDKEPNNHWILTQLGVTYYEQRRYREALKWFLASQRLMPNCPLTLWNLAGTLDSLERPADALKLYTWILLNKKSYTDDPCWENQEWSDALTTDCVYRLGVCFQHIGIKTKAKDYYRLYLDMLSIGFEGSYSINDVKSKLRDLLGKGRIRTVESEVSKALKASLQESANYSRKTRSNPLSKIDFREVVSCQRAASKK